MRKSQDEAGIDNFEILSAMTKVADAAQASGNPDLAKRMIDEIFGFLSTRAPKAFVPGAAPKPAAIRRAALC